MTRTSPGSFIAWSLSALLILSLSACSGPRHLETQLGGRPVEDLKAEARKVEGRWQVELLLPAGRWRIETPEAQSFDLLPGEPRATLRWTVAPDRWSQQDRPFRFDLIGAEGLNLSFAVTYPNSLAGGNAMVELWRILSGEVKRA